MEFDVEHKPGKDVTAGTRVARKRRLGIFTMLRALGYDETFIRMWEYYLCYCEGGFAERVLGDVQMLLVKPGNRCATL